ncbi:hypothetical protein KALB_4028 [Kutzneria albida DSM 43870]|uniref:Pre-toxin TG domain-containing protein n=1 Tax=Kutzneria albida DSM 43870 TaxID=1449976 RepID=W5W8W8_9PSEU|nr:hypothetical protein KALB_4028 [Kutzneria albida DSM 43870]
MFARLRAVRRLGVAGFVAAIVATLLVVPAPAAQALLCDRHPELELCKVVDKVKEDPVAALQRARMGARALLSGLVSAHLREGVLAVVDAELRDAAEIAELVRTTPAAQDAARVAQLVERLKHAADTLDKLKIVVDVLRGALPVVTDSVKRFVDQVKAIPDLDIHVDVAALEANNREMAASLGRLSVSFAGMDEAFEQANASFARMNASLDQVPATMAAMNGSLAELRESMRVFQNSPWFRVGDLSLKGIHFDFDRAFGQPISTNPNTMDPDLAKSLSVLTDFVPGVGTAKNLVEAVIGKDVFTQGELDGFDRSLRGLAAVPVVGGPLKKLVTGAEEAAKTAKATPLGRGSTGRTRADNLHEQLAMDQALAHPEAGKVLPIKMNDARWPAEDGWVKMSQQLKGASGRKVDVHYVRNTRTGEVDDFKFKDEQG